MWLEFLIELFQRKNANHGIIRSYIGRMACTAARVCE